MGLQVVLLILISLNVAPSATADTSLSKLKDSKKYTRLLEALEKVELDKVLRKRDKFTLFAPSNAAFARLNSDEVKCLFNTDKGKAELKKILEFHVAKKRVKELKKGDDWESLNDDRKLFLEKDGLNRIVIKGVSVVEERDIVTDDYVVHGLNGILIPSNVDLVKACGGSPGRGGSSPGGSPGSGSPRPPEGSSGSLRTLSSVNPYMMVVAMALCVAHLAL